MPSTAVNVDSTIGRARVSSASRTASPAAQAVRSRARVWSTSRIAALTTRPEQDDEADHRQQVERLETEQADQRAVQRCRRRSMPASPASRAGCRAPSGTAPPSARTGSASASSEILRHGAQRLVQVVGGAGVGELGLPVRIVSRTVGSTSSRARFSASSRVMSSGGSKLTLTVRWPLMRTSCEGPTVWRSSASSPTVCTPEVGVTMGSSASSSGDAPLVAP